MDLLCVNCGEPWDIHHVLHDEPETFEREGGVILHCPCCPKGELKSDEKKRALRDIGALFGDDIDGYACFLEDINDDLDEIFGELPKDEEE